MRGTAIAACAALVLAALVPVPSAHAGQQTGIMYATQSYDVYEFTPTTTGTLGVELWWARPDGTGAPLFPEAQVDVVVQHYDAARGEWYWDDDLQLFYDSNPWVMSYSIKGPLVDKPLYVSVAPWIGDVPYRLELTFPNPSTTVLDTGPIDVSSPTQKWAYGCSGELYVPSVGAWHSVLQYWPGTLDRIAGVSNVWANWDDYAWGRDAGTEYYELANNWAGVQYYPPVVSDATILASGGGPTTPRPGLWYTLAPQIWTSAARPNVWVDIVNHVYPEPGSLTVAGASAAPAWYTYSWPDAAKSDAIGYSWSVVTNPSASQGSFCGEASTTAALRHAFYGTGVIWLYRTGPYGGRADVYVDGSATPHNATPIELYSPATQWKRQYVVGGLGDGYHTIEIKNAGTRNESSGSYFIYHDAFLGATDPNDPTPSQENDTDGSTVYDWARVASAEASGGGYSANPSTAAAAAFTFSGTSVGLVYRTGPYGGRAGVYVDGVFKETVEMYAAAPAWQLTKTWSGLGAGMHTIFLKNSGTRNDASLSYYVYIDAVRVGTTTIEN